MIDKTTEGYQATRDNIDGMLRNLCAYALTEPEPLQRYVELTHQQVLFDGVVAAIRRERGRALAELAADGVPAATIAELAKLASPQHVRSLVTGAGLTMPRAKKAPRPPSRTPSNTSSRTPSNTSSRRPLKTPPKTQSKTPSTTPSKTQSKTPSTTTPKTPSKTPSRSRSSTSPETPRVDGAHATDGRWTWPTRRSKRSTPTRAA